MTKRMLADWPAVERRFAVSFSLLSLGTGLSLSVLAVYVVRQLHAGTAAYGVAMSAAALCGMVSGPLAGRLADRRDARRTYAVLVWIMAVATALLTVADEWAAFVLLSLLMVCGRGNGAVLGVLVGREVPAERRVRYRAVVKTLSNATMMIGLGLGGIILSVDSLPLFRASFAVEALTLCAAGALIGTSPSAVTSPAKAAESAEKPGRAEPGVPEDAAQARRAGSVYRDTRFLALTGVNAFVMLYSSLLTVGLPLWIAAHAPSLLWLVSVVVAVNMGAVLLVQVPVSRWVAGLRAAVRAGAWGALLFAAAVTVFPIAGAIHGSGGKVSALIVLALLAAGGEVLYAASSWELVYALAPASSLGQYQGTYNLGLDVSMLMAPVLFAWLAGGRHTPGWLVVAGIFALCAGLIRLIARRAGPVTSTLDGAPVADSVGASS